MTVSPDALQPKKPTRIRVGDTFAVEGDLGEWLVTSINHTGIGGQMVPDSVTVELVRKGR